MNTIPPIETVDTFHSIYVDQRDLGDLVRVWDQKPLQDGSFVTLKLRAPYSQPSLVDVAVTSRLDQQYATFASPELIESVSRRLKAHALIAEAVELEFATR